MSAGLEVLTLTYAGEAYETFIESLRWPTEKHYTAQVTLTDGVAFDVTLRPRNDDDDGNVAFRFRRRVELDSVVYVAEGSEVAYIYDDSKPYVAAVHIY